MRVGPLSSRLLTAAAVAQFGRLDLIARRIVAGFLAGQHLSTHHGFSVEFAHHRPYVSGDDWRHLDWRVWARTDRFSVKQYEDETSMRVHLLLDASASMAYGSAGVTKLQYACYLAAALAFLALRQEDPTGLAILDDPLRCFLPARTGAVALRRLLLELETVSGRGATGLPRGLQAVADRLKRRGLIVLLSDLLDQREEVIPALAYFRHKKHEVLVLQVLDPAERSFPFTGPAAFRDAETGRTVTGPATRLRRGYLRELETLLAAYRRGFAANAISYELLDTAAPFATALASYLARRSQAG